MAVITQAEARIALPGLSADDTTVATLISRADSMCAMWCGFPNPTEATRATFDTTSYTRYLRGPGGRDLQLPVWPINAITTIEDDPTEAYNGSTYLVSSGDWRVMPKGVVRLRQIATHGSWTYSEDTLPIKAVWTAGWTAAAAPEDLKAAVVEMTAILWASRVTAGVQSVSAGQGQVEGRAPMLTDAIMAKLAPYRLLCSYGFVP